MTGSQVFDGAPTQANRGAPAPSLCRTRAYFALSEDDCWIWFGVGRATLERVEAGEVEPGDELAERIDRFLNLFGGSWFPLSSTAPRAPLTHGDALLGAWAVPERNGGALPVAPSPGDRPAVSASVAASIHANRGQR